jgi:hypothetical protein
VKNDVTSILRLTGLGGRLLLSFYALATTIVVVLNLGKLVSPVLGVVALALLYAALIVLAMPGKEPFGWLATLSIIALVSAITLIEAHNLATPDDPGYSNWHMGAITFVYLVLALRGRTALAWAGYILFAGIEIAASFNGGTALAIVGVDVARQASTLLIGSLFGLFLRRASRVITSIQETQLSRAAARAATAAATGERERQVARLENDARPALDRILSGEEFTAAEREGFELLEASLRDGIRAAGFSGERLVSETREARARGIQVVLLDDRGAELDETERTRVEDALITQLRESTEGTITARLSPFGRDEIATIVVDEGGAYRRVVVAFDSVEVTHLS